MFIVRLVLAYIYEKDLAVTGLLRGSYGFPWILGKRYESMKAIKIIATMNNVAISRMRLPVITYP